ncbi:TPA: hypothetical protein EYP38_01550 [Candidatus Micrarchaeota archaeon]|nr:hypothetical protein [Candidatus Micrarchaeota archaeon]
MADKKPNGNIPNMLKSAAATMAADVLLLVGFVFVLLGIAKFLNDFVKIPGFGEGTVGVVLVVMGLFILFNSKMRVRIAKVPPRPQMPMQPMPPMSQPPPPKEAPSDSYR